jgi:hypothetical protein
MKLLIVLLATTLFFSCAGRQPSSAAGREALPCENCRSGQEVSFEVKMNKSYREQKSELLALDSGELIGILPALNVIAKHPEKCDYCHAFSESAVEFDFATKEDSILKSRFPNNELVLLFPGSQVPERDSAEFQKAFETLREIPLNENKELKIKLKKLSHRYKIRYIAFASYIEVNIKDKKTFNWESEWSL